MVDDGHTETLKLRVPWGCFGGALQCVHASRNQQSRNICTEVEIVAGATLLLGLHLPYGLNSKIDRNTSKANNGSTTMMIVTISVIMIRAKRHHC